MATTKTRLYRWGDRLIRASHPAHVIAHVAQELDKPRVATQEDLEELFGKGVKPEAVRPVQADLPTT